MSKPASSPSLSVEAEQPGPPKRSKAVAFLAALACIGCCALPLLVPLGVLGTAGVAAATTGLLVVSAVLFGLAGLLWFLHHRRSQQKAKTCADDCAC